MKYLESSTVKTEIDNANSLALSGLNALSSAKGTGIREANNLASLRLSNPELCEGHQGSQ